MYNDIRKSAVLLEWCGKFNDCGSCVLPSAIAVNHMTPKMILLRANVTL